MTRFLAENHKGILAGQLLHSVDVQGPDVLCRVVYLKDLGLGVIINVGEVIGREFLETHFTTDSDKRIFLQDELALLDPPGGEKSPPLARRLPDDVGRTRWLVYLPVLHLAFLAMLQ